MAFLGQTFNANDLPQNEGDGEFLAIPAGDYQVAITEAGLQDTKSGTGQYIKLKMDIVGPTHQGRILFANLNIRNQSQKAEQIGLQQFGDVIRAIGLSSVQDTDQLIGGQLTVKVAKVEDAEYGDSQGFKNEIKQYKANKGGSAPMPSAMPQRASAPAPRQAAVNTPPWAQ